MKTEPLSDEQAIALRKSFGQIVRVFLVSERRFPVAGRNARYSPHDFQTLNFLAEHKSARAGEIGKFLEIAPTTMTGVIDRLQGADLIKRTQDTEDARATRLELTEAGWEMHDAIANQEILNYTAMLCALDEDERDKYVEMTQRIADRVESLA